MAALTADQILQVALQAGFPLATATKMVAIALKESAGDPTAHNTTAPDDSYGLWQINMYGALGPARVTQFGLTSPSDLFDPLVNAQAAYAIWAGNDDNLGSNWYIYGIDAAKYQAALPVAQLAAQRFVAASGAAPPTGGGGSTSTGQTSFSPGRSGAPLRPGSASAPGGLGSAPQPSSSPASPAVSQPLNSSTSKWWGVLHVIGAIGWPILVHFFPWLSVPVAAVAPVLHGSTPSPFGQLFGKK